jgi:hypothetical protein
VVLRAARVGCVGEMTCVVVTLLHSSLPLFHGSIRSVRCIPGLERIAFAHNAFVTSKASLPYPACRAIRPPWSWRASWTPERRGLCGRHLSNFRDPSRVSSVAVAYF